MSWFQSTNLASFAKTALKEAQKTIDKALEINEGEQNGSNISSDRVTAVTEAATDFFASWGVGVGSKKPSSNSEDSSSESTTPKKTTPTVITSSPRKISLQDERHKAVSASQYSNIPPTHKRSVSLEVNQLVEDSNDSIEESSSSTMFKSLTSDVPVTLLALATTVDDDTSGNSGSAEERSSSSSHHHSRSLSDTAFNSVSNFEGSVEILDDADFSSGGALDINNHSQIACFKDTSRSNSKSIEDVKSLALHIGSKESQLNSKESSSKSENHLTEITGLKSSDILIESDMNFSSLSQIDLNVPTTPTPTIDLFPGNHDLLIPIVLELERSNEQSLINQESTFDNSWSWGETEQESSGFVDVDRDANIAATDSLHLNRHDVEEDSNIIVTDVKDQKEELIVNIDKSGQLNQPERTLRDSGFDVADGQSCSQSEEHCTNNNESQNEQDSKVESSLTLSNQEVHTVNEFSNVRFSENFPTSSIEASSPSVIGSPVVDCMPPLSMMIPHLLNPSESSSAECESIIHNNEELLINRDVESPESNYEVLSNSSSKRSTGNIIDLVESSRSSSIVVVPSPRNSSGGSGSAASSGSSGCSGSDGHQFVDLDTNGNATNQHSLIMTQYQEESVNGSPSFERVDPSSSSHSSDPTSPEFLTKKNSHKKGPSSASSSDIEVILSAEYSQIHIPPPVLPETKMISLSSIHQQTSLEMTDSECQTDLLDEAKVLAEELPKKLTLEISEMMSEKDQMIGQLREEGEKLSRKQFELSQGIKKLRIKEKEMENTIKNLKGEVAGKNLENDRLMKSFVNKEASEHNLNETVQKLITDKRNLELQIGQMKSELEDAKENCSTMKASVEDASVEILELKNAILTVQRDSSELDSLTREKSELISRSESLQKEVENLRSTINSIQSKSSTRESQLQSEVFNLTKKIHHLENQLGDMSSDVADATMPLSLEIEKLQAELKNSLAVREKRENQLQSQLYESESKMKGFVDREKAFKDSNLLLITTVSNLEARLQEIEADNRNLKRESSLLTQEQDKKVQEETEKIHKLEKQAQRLTEELERLSKENDQLGLELKSEKIAVDQERKRSQSLVDQVNSGTTIGGSRSLNMNLNQQHTRNNSMSNSTITNIAGQKSGENSPSSHSIISEVSYLDEVFDPNGHLIGNTRSLTPKSFFDSFSSMGLMETLQNQLRHRETEVLQYQEEVIKNERIRKSLNEEIAKLTMQNQEFQMEIERLAELQIKLENVEKNYNALLQMYGEKVEETDELRMDLQDVKDMYKSQIEQLLKRNGHNE